MTEAKADCPNCGLNGSLTFSEWTENGAPHGAGYWPMQMSDVEQKCECALTEAEEMAAAKKAWEAAYEDMAREEAAYATELTAQYDADAQEQAEELAAFEDVPWQAQPPKPIVTREGDYLNIALDSPVAFSADHPVSIVVSMDQEGNVLDASVRQTIDTEAHAPHPKLPPANPE